MKKGGIAGLILIHRRANVLEDYHRLLPVSNITGLPLGSDRYILLTTDATFTKMLVQCWATVADGDLTLNQHCVGVDWVEVQT